MISKTVTINPETYVRTLKIKVFGLLIYKSEKMPHYSKDLAY